MERPAALAAQVGPQVGPNSSGTGSVVAGHRDGSNSDGTEWTSRVGRFDARAPPAFVNRARGASVLSSLAGSDSCSFRSGPLPFHDHLLTTVSSSVVPGSMSVRSPWIS